MRDQAFHAAEGFGEGEAVQAVDEGAHGIFAAGQFERDHPAEAGLLARGERVAGMRAARPG